MCRSEHLLQIGIRLLYLFIIYHHFVVLIIAGIEVVQLHIAQVSSGLCT